jgi:hypothetical protein
MKKQPSPVTTFFSLSILVLASIQPAFAAWQTTEFEVFVGKPHLDLTTEGEDDPHWMELLGIGVSQTVIDELEDYLHELAVALQNDGFADPVAAGSIVPVVTGEDGVKRIRVYLLDMQAAYGSDKLGALASKCDNPNWRPSLLLNSANTFAGERVTAAGYQNMTHELFHAVQYASTFRRVPSPCKQGKWITEGTADAVGFGYAWRLRSISTRGWDKLEDGIPSFSKPWGMRAWYVPLSNRFPTSTEDYATSSFWRDLAELTYARKNNGQHPQSRLALADYSYLADLFATRPPGLGIKHELAWLDDWLKSYRPVMRDLAPVYAQFAASAADHMWRRIPDIRGLARGQRESRWLQFLFQGCIEVNLSPVAPEDRHLFQLPIASSRCFRVKVSGDEPAQELVVQETTLSRDEQAQLWIGAIGGKLFANADIRTGAPGQPDAGKTYAWWRLPIAAGADNIFTVSNLSRTARDTANLNPILHFSLPGWKTSRQAPGAPAGNESSTRQPKTPEEAGQRQQDLRKTPSRNTAMAAMAGRGRDLPEPGCDDYLQSANLCGPQIEIALTHDRGGIPDSALMAGAGGLIARMGSAAGGNGLPSPGANDFLLQSQDMARLGEGEVIMIAIPKIPFGSGATFGNALISVNKAGAGDRGGSLDSLRPAPDDRGLHLPNGSVVITEYSANFMSGSFEAQLVDQAERYGPGNSLLQVVGEISGTFNIAAPWRGDGAVPDMSPDGAMMAGLRDDMLEFLMKLPAGIRGMMAERHSRQLCKLGFEGPELSSLGLDVSCAGSGAAALPAGSGCDCDCRSWELIQSLPGCREECDPKWKAWKCGPYLETGLGELDAETQRYQAEVRQLGLPENVENTWVYGFKISPPDIRAGIWEELERYRQQQPEQQLPAAREAIEAEQAEREARKSKYDDETRRYQAALEQAGYSRAEVDGLTEIFAPSPPAVREVFWADLKSRQGN